MSIRNLRIGLRASLSFAVLASLLMVVGLFGLGQMKALRERAAVIEESWMPSIESIHDAAANIASIRLESLRLITSTQAAVRERSKGILTAQRQELLKRLDDHKALIANDQELQTTLDRIAWFQRQVAQLRKTEKNPVNYRTAVAGFLAELDRM